VPAAEERTRRNRVKKNSRIMIIRCGAPAAARKEESSQQQLDATPIGNSNDLFVLIYWY
jgi:hypothetical protein